MNARLLVVLLLVLAACTRYPPDPLTGLRCPFDVTRVDPPPAEAASGALDGFVTNCDGRPIARLIVTISAAGYAGSRTAVTDERGYFVFANMPPLRYRADFDIAPRSGSHPSNQEWGHMTVNAKVGEIEHKRRTRVRVQLPIR